MKVLTVIGARPQFIKAAPVSKALRSAGHSEYLLHTGQHYDHLMSRIFFDEMGIPEPDINLSVGSGTHGVQTGTILIEIENVLLQETPDVVLVYGDTNSTLAGALAAIKLHIPVAHVEAGLRSFNRTMPEEHNRVLTDHCADWLFCPTQTAVDHLRAEGVTHGVHLVGDTMYDAVLQYSDLAEKQSAVLDDLNLDPKAYLLATVHRPYNTDQPENLRNILEAFIESGYPVVFPVHPRTRQRLTQFEGDLPLDRIRLIEPVGYLDMLLLEKNARMILTDSGGIQKEAYFFGVPCTTLRPETEWVETLNDGWNELVSADKKRILARVHSEPNTGKPAPVFGDGHAAEIIAQVLADEA